MARRHQDGPRLDQVEAVREFGRRKAPVLTRDNGADPSGGQKELEILEAVLRQDRDPVALPHAVAPQPARKRGHALSNLAIAQAAITLHQRRTIGMNARLHEEQARHAAGCSLLHQSFGFSGLDHWAILPDSTVACILSGRPEPV